MRSLANKIALVTGATRGIGKGIALQLGESGAKVYITGRTLRSKKGSGSLEETVDEIKKRGGEAIPVECDHEKSEQVEELFKRISKDQNGQLDILVNNAYKGVGTILENMRLKFWEYDPSVWDDINNVGLRNHYICTVFASKLMIPRQKGLIVNISSFGGQRYLFNVPYGVGKAALDRMAVDCGIELKKHKIACLSLMLGAVRTETMTDLVSKGGEKLKLKSDPNSKTNVGLKEMFDQGETVEFGGKIITNMASNSKIMKYSGKIVIASDYADKYGIKDIDGRRVPSHRELQNIAPFLPKNLRFLTSILPGGFKIPQAFIDIANSKYI
ncbi:dehydrogenase reductase SDR family member 1-like [Brachionus plicatilis]|uniref:Dehydrogenase reductase SDR family member 1-like n=1 Tax=Brachionus plicatilis TaxID=10195 RepID=A0A3M7S5W7_BRAPC|nr:dehydrogenase reductase SDR family member 1-like [Brachionus plicatilis]